MRVEFRGRVSVVSIVSVMSLAIGGCTIQEPFPIDRTPDIASAPATPTPDSPPTPIVSPTATEVKPGAITPLSTRMLNIIVVNTTKDRGMSSLSDQYRDEARANVKKLLRKDPETINSLTSAFSAATFGRLAIGKVRVRKAKNELNLPEGCLDADDITPDTDKLAALARQSLVKNAINVAVAMAANCSDDPVTKQRTLGFFIAGDTPTVLAAGIANQRDANWVTIHEWAHGYDKTLKNVLPHAGVATCKDPVQAKGCVTDQYGDNESLMGYKRPEAPFSTPELEDLGLLHASEILDARKISVGGIVLGEVSSRDMLLPKIIKLPATFNGRKAGAYISVGKKGKIEVHYDKSLSDENTKIDKGAYEKQLPQESTVRINRKIKPGDVVIRSGKKKYTYVGKAPTGNGYVLDVTNA